MVAARRPLTVEEIREALSVEPGEKAWNADKLINNMQKVLDCCGSLVIIDEELWTVHFAHHSIKQHLISNAEGTNSAFALTSRSAESALTTICITYLNSTYSLGS